VLRLHIFRISCLVKFFAALHAAAAAGKESEGKALHEDDTVILTSFFGNRRAIQRISDLSQHSSELLHRLVSLPSDLLRISALQFC
jgi:hypothetical protein